MNKQNRADQRKFHFIYKTTNIVNDKYYLGMHSTNNLDDGYVGSGTRLWRSINYYGKENFKVEILEFLSDRESLKIRETELVNEDLLKDSQCMNLTLGGDGGWHHCNSNSKLQSDKCKRGNLKMKELRITDPIWTKKNSETRSNTIKNSYAIGARVTPEEFRLSFLGKQHTHETKIKIGKTNAEKQSGNKNSRFGTVWVYSTELKKSKSIPKDTLLSVLEEGWKLGRKIKFS